MRSDASRNHEAILTSAIAVLADAPQASMRHIADASGTGRTTLYRHFPDRRALVEAIYARVVAEADAITARQLTSQPGSDPVEVLADLAVELAGLGDRYRFLEQHVDPTAKDLNRHRRGSPLHEYLLDGQRAGTIREDLSADWLFEVIVGLVTQAAGHRLSDHPDRDAMLSATVRSLLTRPARAGAR